MDATRHFKVVGWLWLTFGAIGFLFTCWRAVLMGHSSYTVGGIPGLVGVILGCGFTGAPMLVGFAVLRHWDWSRIAMMMFGTFLLPISVIGLFFSEVAMAERIGIFVPASLLALYSVVVSIVLRDEPRAA